MSRKIKNVSEDNFLSLRSGTTRVAYQNEGAWRPKWLIPLLGGRVCGGAEEAFGGWTGGRGPVFVAVLGGRRVRRGWLWRAWGTRIARSRRDLRNVPLDLCLKT